jgi:hypothetical protein
LSSLHHRVEKAKKPSRRKLAGHTAKARTTKKTKLRGHVKKAKKMSPRKF